MKIESSQITFGAMGSFQKKDEVKESLKAWAGNERPHFEENRPQNAAVTISLSNEALKGPCVNPIACREEGEELDPKTLFLKLMVEILTGHSIHLDSVSEFTSQAQGDGQTASELLNQVSQDGSKMGYGVEYDYHESYQEEQSLQFEAAGIIKTADGKEIRFQLQFSLHHAYSRETNFYMGLGDAPKTKDPLVFNFSGNAAELTSQKFKFDINGDGKTEWVSFVGSGSGFLALDKNNDGKINDGTELFGPATGNGLSELATFDGDSNGWIDESDPIYKKLQIWSKDAQGHDQLTPLASANVGGIYLHALQTPFSHKTSDNQLLANLTHTGVFVREDGTTGTVQQLDLAV